MVKRSDLAVGAEVRGGDLKGDLIVRLFVHLLGQKVGFSHQGVGFHNLLPESRKALTEQLIPDKQTQTHTERQHSDCLINDGEDLSLAMHLKPAYSHVKEEKKKGINPLIKPV